jgi:methylmalonyl-CoA/ethylmalonyl-CoA epimerase
VTTTGDPPDPRVEVSLVEGVDAVFDHAAHAARRIRDLLPLYQDLLGGRFAGGGDNRRAGFRVVQLGFRDGTRVELLEPLAGSTFLDTFLAGRPQGGLHHLTFRVTDIRAALHRVEELGLTAISVHLDDPRWRELFVHPRQASGALIQLAQPGPGPLGWPGLTLDDVLAGRGPNGDGRPSP